MPNIFKDVVQFHQHFELEIPSKPTLPHPDEMAFRVKFLNEEIEELCQAYEDGNMVAMADAIGDLVYVALGLAARAGIPFNDVFAAIQKANMSKRKAMSADESKRGYSLDIVKGPEFVPPETKILWILNERMDIGDRIPLWAVQL